MGIVIRTAPAVFKQTLPLVAVFGAYRRYPRTALLDLADIETIEAGVALARRIHAPLAFCREVGTAEEPGVWLPGCRPRVSDRVFDTAPGSALENREFASVLLGLTGRTVALLGPADDSSLTATAADAARAGHRILRLTTGKALHNRSTTAAEPIDVSQLSGRSGGVRTVSLDDWANSLVANETVPVPV